MNFLAIQPQQVLPFAEEQDSDGGKLQAPALNRFLDLKELAQNRSCALARHRPVLFLRR